MNHRQPLGLDPAALERQMQASAAQRQDVRQLIMIYTGLSPMQLEGLGMSVAPCLCGKCAGPKISFAALHFDPRGGIMKIAPGPEKPSDPDETKP